MIPDAYCYDLDEAGEPIPMPRGASMPTIPIEKRTLLCSDIGDHRVSTVFLVVNHAFDGGSPVLWETMIFGGQHSDYQERYTSRADAIAGHARAVDLCLDDPKVSR